MKTIAQQIKWNFETNDELRIKDNNGKLIYWEDSNRVWEKSEYDSQGRLIYRENSFGRIIDNRVQTITYEGRKYQLIP